MEPQKIASHVEVSRKLMADGGFLIPELFRPRLLAQNEHAAEKAARKAKRDAARAEADERHRLARERVDPALVPVLDHHGPVVSQDYGYGQVACEGCDAGWNAEDNPEWPCSTWLLIAGDPRL
jgi:hypothetical protein